MWNLFRGLTRALAGSRKDPMPKGSLEPSPDQYGELAFWEITNGLWKPTWCINEELHSCPRSSEKDSQRPGVGGTDPGPHSSLPNGAERSFSCTVGGEGLSFLLLKVAVHLQAWNKGCPGFGCTSFSSDTSQPCSKPRLMCNVSETLQPCYVLHRTRTAYSHRGQLLNGELYEAELSRI